MRRVTPWLLIALISAAVYQLALSDWTHRFDKIYYDFLLARSTLSTPDDVVIVAIDEESLAKVGAWPWPRSVHAQLLERLQASSLVVFDIIFSEPQSTVLEGVVSSGDEEFASAIETHGRVILPVYLSENSGGFFPQEILPIPGLANAAAGLGHIQLNFERDGIARSVYLQQGIGDAYWPHAALAAQQLLNGEQQVEAHAAPAASAGPSESDIPDANSPAPRSDPSIIALDKKRNIRFAGGPGVIGLVSYADVLNQKVPDSIWENKVVFVGAIAEGLGDYVPTTVGFMPGVEFNANIFESLRQEAFILPVETTQAGIAQLAAFLFSAILLVRLPPRSFLFSTISLALCSLLASAVALIVFSLWVPVGAYLFGLALFYPLWSWRRIEIALKYLLGELSDLDKASSIVPQKGGIDSIRSHLDGLKKIALIEDYEISPLERMTSFDELGLPLENPAQQMLVAPVDIDGKEYGISLKSGASKEVLRRPVKSLLERELAVHSPESNSIELVERTIEKIQSAQKQIDTVRERMNRSLARLQDAVLITDATCRIVFQNIAAERLFANAKVDQSIVELDAEIGGHVWRGILLRLLSDGEPVYHELDLVNETTVLCQASWLAENQTADSRGDSDAAADYLLFVFTDVSSLRAAEQSKNEALAFLSHDMRSPIVSQLATIESVRQAGGVEADQLVLLSRLEQFGRKSLKYAEDFLQLSRAENLDKRAFHLVDVHGVIDGAVSQQQGLALQKGIQLRVERVDEDVWTDGDAGLLERAISNLISNALQHSPDGSRVTVALAVENQVMISVIDQGAGIAEEAMTQLFEPYFRSRIRRADERSRFGVQSYGLGLSFVRTVVNRHGGSLDVHSVLDQGSEFRIFLPLSKLD